MKRFQLYIIALATLFLASCSKSDDTVAVSKGEADFSTYIAFGNSLTAGYADNALYDEGQEVAFPNLLAEQMVEVGGGEFTTPWTNSDIGIGSDGNAKLILGAEDGELAPVPAAEEGDLSIFTDNIADQGPFNNMGVPGATSITSVMEGYSNPFFSRMTADFENSSMLSEATAQDPTFFTVFIGNNDVLGYATAGGVDAEITSVSDFSSAYTEIIDAFTENGAKGAVANIPDVTSTAFFTYIPWNIMELTEEEAQALNEGIEEAVTPSLEIIGGLIGEDIEDYDDLLETGIIPIFQEGKNGILIEDDDVPLLGIRLMEEGELVLLTAQEELLAFQEAFESGELIEAIGGDADILEKIGMIQDAALSDESVLTHDEVDNIQEATDEFNAIIKSKAQEKELAFVDVNAFLNKVKDDHIYVDGKEMTTEFVTGGTFSLDGIHLTPKANAVLANEFIEAINNKYDAFLPKVRTGHYGDVKFP